MTTHTPMPQDIGARLDRYRDHLAKGLSAALRRAVAQGGIAAATVGARAQLLVAMAVAINWSARASGPAAAQQLADAVRLQVQQWRA